MVNIMPAYFKAKPSIAMPLISQTWYLTADADIVIGTLTRYTNRGPGTTSTVQTPSYLAVV